MKGGEKMKEQKRRLEINWKVFPCAMILVVMLMSPCMGAEDPAKFPSKPITMIIQWSPGGSTDLSGRKMADLASKVLGQPIVVENKAGGGGVIGTTAIANASPDGYTIGTIQYSATTLIPHLRSVPYKTKEDFTWIMQFSEYTFPFCVQSASPWKTFKEFIEEARRNPGKLNYATQGPLTAQHILLEQIFSSEKVKLNHVPVGGALEVVQQLLGGHIDAGMSADLLPHVRSGKLRGLAIQGEKRFELFPDIPTFSEIGYKAESPLWMAVCAPKGVDSRIIKKLFDAFKQAQEHPSFKELCATLYLRPVFRDSETLKNMVFRDFDSQKIILKELGLAKP